MTKELGSDPLVMLNKPLCTFCAKWFPGLIAAVLFTCSAVAQSSPPEPPTVKLLDAGSEPRKALRFHVKAGDKETMTMTMKMSMEMPGMGGAGAMKIPTMTMPMDVTVQSVAPNGDISYQSVMAEPGIAEDPNAMPAMVQAMKASLATMKGLTMSGVVSDRGISKQADMKIPDNADPSMRQSMDQMKDSMRNMGAPLPAEPVGVGAKWEVKTHVKSGGIAIEQTATYQLASLEENHWTAKCTMEQTAGNQKIENPSVPVEMNLVKMNGTGTGTINVDLSKILPLHGNMDEHVDMNSEVKMGQTNQPIVVKMDMNIGMEGK